MTELKTIKDFNMAQDTHKELSSSIIRAKENVQKWMVLYNNGDITDEHNLVGSISFNGSDINLRADLSKKLTAYIYKEIIDDTLAQIPIISDKVLDLEKSLNCFIDKYKELGLSYKDLATLEKEYAEAKTKRVKKFKGFFSAKRAEDTLVEDSRESDFYDEMDEEKAEEAFSN